MPRSRGGPHTEAGKAMVSRNAIRHGIRSTAPVIPGLETEDDWRRHRDGIFESLQPDGHLQEVLADRVANLLWRLHRVIRYEVAVASRSVHATERHLAVTDAYPAGLTKALLPDVPPDRLAARREARVLPHKDELEQIMRYETHLHRQCLQTLHELEALQARRKGLPAHLARLDISLPPSSYSRGA